MTLKEQFEEIGNWLFRWRSYLPLLMIGIILIGMRHFEYPFYSHKIDQLWEIICMMVSFFGLGIRCYAVGHTPKGTSGRNTRGQKAAVLNTKGAYSIVRHPLYLGNFFCWLGISVFPRIWWINIICILAFWLYYEKIMFAEEEFLRKKFGGQFKSWAKKTPAFFPKLSNWSQPDLPFSFKKILKKEYSGFFAIISIFTFLEITGDCFVKGKLEIDSMWLSIFSVGLIIYLTLMLLKKKTRLLDIKER